MDKQAQGAEIQRRLDALGIKDREWHARTGIDRKTLRRAIAGAETTRESTYLAIESWLDKLEAKVQGEPVWDQGNDTDEGYVEFTIEGNFGVRAVVKGPVRDMDELQRAVARLVHDMRAPEDSD